MASSASRLPPPTDENTGNAASGKTSARSTRPLGDAARRPILQDLTPNTSVPSRQSGQASGKSSMSKSPLKRGYRDIFGGDDKGFTYLKRRRLSHGEVVASNTSIFRQDKRQDGPQQVSTRFGPLSPPSSGRHAVRASPARTTKEGAVPAEKESDEDSGRESQKSNATRGSFDSLINYDPSSQQALASQALNYVNIPPSVPAHTTHTPVIPSLSTSTSLTDTVRAQAEALRLRLKVAIYKVRTNQINVPFSRLRAPAPPAKPTPRVHEDPPPAAMRSPMFSSADDDDSLPTTSRVARTTTTNENHPYGLGIGLLPAPDMTPNPNSRSFMPMSRAPSSSPPFIPIPPSSLPRHAMSRDTMLMGRMSHDHESLDSEATELAEDNMQEGGEVYHESPSQGARRPANMMFAADLPR